MYSLVILGSTGSIGENTLKIIDAHPDRLRVVGLAAHSNAARLAEQVNKYQPEAVALTNAEHLGTLKSGLRSFSGEILSGPQALTEIAAIPDADTAVVAVVGSVGYRPTLAAIESGKRICLANKETLVVAGSMITAAARRRGVELLPIDSEHSAIWQCLKSGRPTEVEKIFLTGSGGPFRTRPRETFTNITKAEALAHPNWNMGAKITIDSATMMNKAFEIIEAVWLFGVAADKIDVVIHPQSIVHSAVRFTDGSVIAQMGHPDMKLPIQYALLYPDRVPVPQPLFDLADCTNLTFEIPDEKRYPALPLARRVIELGQTYPAVLNAADEIAVELFLDGKILFTDILDLVEGAIDQHEPITGPNLSDLDGVGKWAADWVKTASKKANASRHMS
jgi:1-deoxy-D-xylulose-5-phosphate reductoisomerase